MTLCFYLMASANLGAVTVDFAVLPASLSFGAGTYFLAAIYAAAADHAVFLAANPQPVGWTGTVGDARAVLRANDLIASWWIFDQFAAAREVSENAHFSSI